MLGLGGNVARENKPFVAHVDAEGQSLDGARGTYTWRCATRPPGSDIWSLTLYERSTGQVYGNPLERYKIGPDVPGCSAADDGTWTVAISHARPTDTTNWLPAPAAPFVLAIRTWQPSDDVLDGRWTPEPIHLIQ